MTSDLDAKVRLAAFDFLRIETDRAPYGVLCHSMLAAGFPFEGQRVPLVSPQGIFKPAILREVPLTIRTTHVEEGEAAPYRDVIGSDGFLRYCYRGTDPNHRDNVGLSLAHRSRVPLIYLHGVAPGRYVAAWPVFIVAESPAELTFTVNVEDRALVSMGNLSPDDVGVEARRRHITREVQQRLHQENFRQRVLAAYRSHCAICRLRHAELLEAAHILPDGHPHGEPVVPNGLALCKLHHAAFDADILGIRPDYQIEVRLDVLEEKDGPMLKHGLQGFHRQRLWTPSRPHLMPKPEYLEERYGRFRRAS